jgi:hypothetical protein
MDAFREIPMAKGLSVFLNEEDYERLLLCEFADGFIWTGRVCDRAWKPLIKPHTTYAVNMLTMGKGQRELRMHRLISCARAGQIVDHRDGNGLNNRRENLRLVDAAGNARNRAPTANREQFKGVAKHKQSGRFEAYIKCGGRKRHLGLFSTAEEAAYAYDRAARELFGDCARPNF